MNNSLTTLASLLILAASAAAADISVHITDPHQKAIAGATVSLISGDSGEQTLSTDSNGSCNFASVPAGPYFVQAEAPGFDASSPRTIDVEDNSRPDVTISLGIAQVRSSVVVTASGTPQSTDEVSKALTVVDSDTMSLRVDKAVGDALIDVPGFRVQQLGGPLSAMFFKTRGLPATDTAVLVDGLRLRDAAGTQADASDVLEDLLLTDTSRIEVLRGAGSSLYGTDATGGVVNIVTDEGGGRTRGSISLDGGSLGSIRGAAHLAGSLDQNRIQYSLGVTHWNVMSGINGDSPARNTSEQGQITFRLSPIAWISARIYAGDSFGFVRISPMAVVNLPASGIVQAIPVSLTQERAYESGTPLSQLALGPATFLPDAFDSDSTRAGRFFTGALRFTIRPSERLSFTAQYQNLRTTRDYGDGPGGPGFQPTGTNLSQYLGRIQTVSARVDAALGRFQHFDAGYEFENEDFRNGLQPPPPVQDFFSDISQRSHALFAQDQIRLLGGRLLFAAGYRAQFFSLNAPTFQPAAGAPFAGQTFPAPPTAQTGDVSAAYTIRRSGTKFRTHAGRGYRAPSLFERFGTYFDGSSYTLFGDPRLRPDRSSSIDGGIDQTFWNSRVQLSATYFYTRLNQVIIFDTTGAINSLTDPLGRNGGYRDTGGGLARGVEFSAAIAATSKLQLTGAYTYTDAREAVPLVPGVWQSFDSPRHQYSVFATERFSTRITGYFGYVGSTDYLASVYGGAFQFSGQERAQTSISYRMPLKEFSSVRFYFKADNLFNQTYFEDGFRTPGITFTGGTKFDF
jgi:vitamin B12 transporter